MLTILNNALLEELYEKDTAAEGIYKPWKECKNNAEGFTSIDTYSAQEPIYCIGSRKDVEYMNLAEDIKERRGWYVLESDIDAVLDILKEQRRRGVYGYSLSEFNKYIFQYKSDVVRKITKDFLHERQDFWNAADLSTGLGASVMKKPTPKPEIIKGLLRQGHKMLLTGASKAGKSFLLMELATALAYNKPWLNFECKQGRVLYINLEIDPITCQGRFFDVANALAIPEKERKANKGNLVVWNMRGQLETVESLCDKVSWFTTVFEQYKDERFDAIIIDPLYMIIDGNENDAGDIKQTFNYLEAIAARTGCAVIVCHHHSKGNAGGKKVIDRASGSGVFARASDTFMDITELDLTDEGKAAAVGKYATGWRVEVVARDFPPHKPLNIWFNHPVHVVDETGILEKQGEEGSRKARLAKSSKRKAGENREARFAEAFRKAIKGKKFPEGETPTATIAEIVKHYGTTAQNVRNVVKDLSDKYSYENKLVCMKTDN